MLILAIDLGKAKSLACWYQADGAMHEFRTVPTRPGDLQTLLSDRPVDRVVIEICDAAGWIVDLCRTLGSPIHYSTSEVHPSSRLTPAKWVTLLFELGG